MALVGTLNIPPELAEAFRKLFTASDNRRYGAVRKHGYLMPRAKKLNVSTRSLLPQIRDLRDTLTTPEIDAWKAAAAESGQNYWNLFVQDTAYRIKYGIGGLATPSPLHQYKVGRIEILAPAQKVIIAQYHPNKYWASKKMRGPTTIREDVAIYETLLLPLEIGLSYKSNLSSVVSSPIAKFYAIIYSSYQGRTIESQVGFTLDLSSAWQRQTVTATEVIGVARSYDLWIELDGVTGTLDFDNTLARHTGTNYARDKRCNDVNNELTTVNYQIEKSWEEQFLPAGASFDSIYPADSIN